VQYDESGRAFTKQDVIDNLKTGSIRYTSIVSTGRHVRLWGEFAIVHGSEQDEGERAARRSPLRYV